MRPFKNIDLQFCRPFSTNLSQGLFLIDHGFCMSKAFVKGIAKIITEQRVTLNLERLMKQRLFWGLGVLAMAGTSLFAQEATEAAGAAVEAATTPVDTGNTAWMMIATGLVLLMMPGLAMFYGGLARTKNVLGTMMHTFVCMAIIGVFWTICGYGLCFGESINGVIGWDAKYFFLKGIDTMVESTGIPTYILVMFQCMFAIITPALISGALAERVYFRGYCLFILLWVVLVYCPLCHMIWNEGGLLFKMGVVDLAGGLVIHVSAGISALVVAILLGKRIGHPTNTVHPNNLVMTLIGGGLLWMGWFGFNAGSTLESGLSASRVIANTHISACSGALIWLVIEGLIFRKATALGFASGMLAGLVVITPAAATVAPAGALALGALSSIACYLALLAKDKFGYDDSLDCFGIHGIGSGLGVILLVFFAREGEAVSMKAQLIGMGITIALAAVATFVIFYIVKFTVGFRLPADMEKAGLDSSLHGEQGYGMLNLN